jgi:hypothetical protein
VDFLYHTSQSIIHARLVIYITTRENSHTYKLDRTTVTVGAPRMLAMCTIPASAVASSSTWASSGCYALVAGEGVGLLSFVYACESSALAAFCAASGTTTLVVGAGLTLLSVTPPTVPQVSSSPWSTGSEGGISCDNTRFNCQNIVLTGKYSTTLLAVHTSWLVDSVIFNFLAARFRATLRGLHGGAGMLASRLAGFSTMRGTLGRPGRLNLDRS